MAFFVVFVSQKYDYLSKLEELSEDISLYFREWMKNESDLSKARPNEIRYRFSLYKFYEIIFIDLKQKEYEREYNFALEKYNSFFPAKDTFSMNRKA